MTCSVCGKEISKYAMYCIHCGAKNNESTAEEWEEEPLCRRFGQMTEEQRARACDQYIFYFNITDCPEEIQKFLAEWHEKIKEEKYRTSAEYMKRAEICFGYGDKTWKIKARTLDTYDEALEKAASDILKGLKAIGCNYGSFYGQYE